MVICNLQYHYNLSLHYQISEKESVGSYMLILTWCHFSLFYPTQATAEMIVSLISSLQRRSSFKPFWRGDLFIFFVFLSFYLNKFLFLFLQALLANCFSALFCHINFPLVLRIFPSTAIFKTNILDPIPCFREAELSPAQREELLRQLSQWPTKQVQLVVTFLLLTCFFWWKPMRHSFLLFSFFAFVLLHFCSFGNLWVAGHGIYNNFLTW